MPKLDTRKILTYGAGLISVTVLIYMYFIRGSGDTPVVDITATPTEEVGKDILVLVDQLNAVKIDSALFDSNLFRNLRDVSIPVTLEEKGRPSPFAFIGSEIGTFVGTKVRTKSGE